MKGGSPEFLLADTLWAAFTRPTIEEWTEYVRQRRRQGFNAVNISVLPIAHDASESASNLEPFLRDGSGDLDLGKISATYFDRARALCAIAAEEDMTPVLVALWCNYVPGTWGARRTPHLVMTENQMLSYVDYVAGSFSDFDPIYVISGDERFDDPLAVQRYRLALERIKMAAPSCLTTMHSTPDAHLPDRISSMPELDFYTYQSGHDTGWEERAHTLADQYLRTDAERPIVDLEPCYEGHGFGAGRGRHTAVNVRLASWTAVLAGASAGLGYAAHGAWSWHRHGDAFGGEQFSGTPFPVHEALAFSGADDVGLLRHIVETHNLYDMRPAQSLLLDDGSGVRVGKAGATVALYLPHPFAIRLKGNLEPGSVVCWDLARRRLDRAVIRHEDGVTVVEQPDFLGDCIVLLKQ